MWHGWSPLPPWNFLFFSVPAPSIFPDLRPPCPPSIFPDLRPPCPPSIFPDLCPPCPPSIFPDLRPPCPDVHTAALLPSFLLNCRHFPSLSSYFLLSSQWLLLLWWQLKILLLSWSLIRYLKPTTRLFGWFLTSNKATTFNMYQDLFCSRTHA